MVTTVVLRNKKYSSNIATPKAQPFPIDLTQSHTHLLENVTIH